jgi:hypothetical protein
MSISQELKIRLIQASISNEDTRTRVHRGISWLKASENESLSDDLRFMCLWTSFNACYASLLEEIYKDERGKMWEFLSKLIDHDKHNSISQCLWDDCFEQAEDIIDNPYLFRDFWQTVHGDDTEWEYNFEQSILKAKQCKEQKNILLYCMTVIERIYILRNQLVHGGSTHGGKMNRQQLQQCILIMDQFVPVIMNIIMQNPDIDWGLLMYPPL